jgi:bla regulator protein BlaR1
MEYLSEVWAAIAPAVGNHLWQSTLFAAVAAIMTLALRKNQARIRYRLWLAASVKFLIPFSLLISLGGHLARPSNSANVQSDFYSVAQVIGLPFTGKPV